MSKRKLDVTFFDAMDKGERLVFTFTRPVSYLEATGIFQAIKEACKRNNP